MKVRTYDTREAWLDARRLGIGSSDAPTVMGVNPYASELLLYADKVQGLAEREDPDDVLLMGHVVEPMLISLAGAKLGVETSRPNPFHTIEHPDLPWCLATIDAEILPGDRGPGVVECKMRQVENHETDRLPRSEDDCPLEVQVQVQHQLAVTGWDWGVVSMLVIGYRRRWHAMWTVERNEAFIGELLRREGEFWRRVEERDPPPATASEACREAIATLHPEDDGSVVALPTYFDRLLAHRAELLAEADRASAQVDEIENQIRLALGPAAVGTTERWKVTHKATARGRRLVVTPNLIGALT